MIRITYLGQSSQISILIYFRNEPSVEEDSQQTKKLLGMLFSNTNTAIFVRVFVRIIFAPLVYDLICFYVYYKLRILLKFSLLFV